MPMGGMGTRYHRIGGLLYSDAGWFPRKSDAQKWQGELRKDGKRGVRIQKSKYTAGWMVYFRVKEGK